MKDILLTIRDTLRRLLTLDDAADEQQVIEGIRSAIEFRGAKLWILTLAVFVASLGLNINSAAVIIGAMLISPLMGPIIGMGLSVAIYDSDMLKRSVRNYLVATLFSVVTATLYFLISPYSVAQSELLARTSPTIYDVLIAFCGGLAGIIALGSRSQRQGNVIPGVAIATALMPPLCTIGFGLATASWHYVFGALYLFLINTIFIALATFLGATFIMRFHKITDPDPVRHRRNKNLITILVVLTIVPAVILTITMVRETYYEQHISQFVQNELHWRNTQVVSQKSDYEARTLNVVIIGQEVDSLQIQTARDRLPKYGLEGVALQVVQSSGMSEEEVQSIFDANRADHKESEALITQQRQRIAELEQQLRPYEQLPELASALRSEMQLLWPSVQQVSVGYGLAGSVVADSASVADSRLMVVVSLSSALPKKERPRMQDWLLARVGQDADVFIIP